MSLKKSLAFFLSVILVLGLVNFRPMQAEAATILYEENFNGYEDGALPIPEEDDRVSVVENADKKLFARVAKNNNDGFLHIYCEESGTKGGPQMRIKIDASEIRELKITYRARSNGDCSARLNVKTSGIDKQLSYVESDIWTIVQVVIDFEYFTVRELYDSVSKLKNLDGFDATTDLSNIMLCFLGGTLKPGCSVDFDDIVISAKYKNEVEQIPYVPVETPEKKVVPVGAYAFVDTDFSDVRPGYASSTGVFAGASTGAKIVDVGENRLVRYWADNDSWYSSYVDFRLPTDVDTYELDMDVMVNDKVNVRFDLGTMTRYVAYGPSLGESMGAYNAGEWNHVHLSLDLAGKSMTIALNGTVMETVSFAEAAVTRRQLYLYIRAEMQPGGATYVDNLSFYTTEAYSEDIFDATKNKIHYDKLQPETPLNENSFVNNLKQHPRLFVRDWNEMQQKIADSEMAKKWYANLKTAADNALKTAPTKYSLNSRGNVLEAARKARDRIISLAFVYKIEEDEKYFNRAYEEMLAYGDWPDWSGFTSTLVTAELLQGYAYAYDWLYDDLTVEQRLEIEHIVQLHALPDFIYNYEGTTTTTNFTKNSINWNPICNATAIAWALASADESPAISEYILETAPPFIQNALKPYTPQGAYPEGVSYWDYGTTFLFFASDFLENAFVDGFELPEDYVYWTAPGIADTPDYAIYLDGPGGRFNYGDCVVGHTSCPVMYWVANRFEKPYYAWWQDRRQIDMDKYMSGYDAVAALAWYNPDYAYYVEGAFGLDKFYDADDAFNGAAMRSSWDDATALYAALQGGKNAANHQHLSLGTYVVDYMGKRFVRLLDYYNNGNSVYDYMHYYKRAESYNCLVINPSSAADQNQSAVASMTDHYSDDHMAYAVLDLSSASDGFVSYKRGVMLADDRSRVVVQDEAVANAPSEYYWFANTDAEISIAEDGKSAVLTMDGDKMLARIVEGPAAAKFDVMERESLFSNMDNEIGDDVGQKLFIHLTNTTTLNLAVEYVPITENTTPEPWEFKPLKIWKSYASNNAFVQTTQSETAEQYVFTTVYANVPKNAYLVVALYDENDRMICAKMQTIGSSDTATSTLDKVSYAYAKVMLLENFVNMRILATPEIL